MVVQKILLTAMQQEEGPGTVTLSEACLYTVFSLLPAKGLASAACVNRHWRDIISNDALWQIASRDLDGDAYKRNTGEQLLHISKGW